MTLEEFVDKMVALKERPTWKNDKEKIVRVRLHNVSLGPVASTKVERVGSGIDWDVGTFFIYTEEKVYREQN